MKSETAIEDAGACLWQLWQAGETIDALPPHQKPATRAEGYAIQAVFEKWASAPRIGWKIAATSTAGQQHIGVDGPLAGRIFRERVYDSGARISIAGNRMRVVEPEFAFRFATGLPPRAAPYATGEVVAAVAGLHLALELPDSRFTDFAVVGGPSLIADDACARDFVIGPATSADWRRLDLARHEVGATVHGRYDRTGIGANVLGDPLTALTWLADELRTLGIGVKAGEVVSTGTCMVPLEIQPGDRILADFGVLGTIRAEIA